MCAEIKLFPVLIGVLMKHLVGLLTSFYRFLYFLLLVA